MCEKASCHKQLYRTTVKKVEEERMLLKHPGVVRLQKANAAKNDCVREDYEERTLLRVAVCKRTVKRESCLRLGNCVWDGGEERVLPKYGRVRESCAERDLPGATLCRRTAEQRAGEGRTLPKAAVCEKAAKCESCQKRPCARRLLKDKSSDK